MNRLLVRALVLTALTAAVFDGRAVRADPPPTTPRSGDAARATDAGTARVHLRSDDSVPLVLESLPAGSSKWTACCTMPCDVELPIRGDYRVSADGVMASACIHLTPTSGTGLVLDVHPVSRRVHTAGLALLGVGLVLFTAGDVMSDVFLAFKGVELADGHPPPTISSELVVPGLIIAAVGLAALGTGGALFLSTRNPTTVIQSPSPVRAPGSQEVARETASTAPSYVAVPLVSVPF